MREFAHETLAALFGQISLGQEAAFTALLLSEREDAISFGRHALALLDLLVGPRVPEATVRRPVQQVKPATAGATLQTPCGRHITADVNGVVHTHDGSG